MTKFSTLKGRARVSAAAKNSVAEAGARTGRLSPHSKGRLCQRLKQALNTVIKSQCPVCLVLGCQLAHLLLAMATGLTGMWSYLVVPNSAKSTWYIRLQKGRGGRH